METLSDRMKRYEDVNRTYLTSRLPIILRIDGKNFSNYTKCFRKPYDALFNKVMRETAQNLCENIEGCRFAYTQSDEISLFLVNYDNIAARGWFKNNVQKMDSVAASMTTFFFQKNLMACIDERAMASDEYDYIDRVIDTAQNKPCVFDCRCFVLPKEEVVNYFIWRQQDCIRNSINALACYYFPQKGLQNKNSDEKKKMLLNIIGIDWEDMNDAFKYGTALYKCNFILDFEKNSPLVRKRWNFDSHTPNFVNNKNYIERFI